LQGWLPAGDHDAVQEPFPALQKATDGMLMEKGRAPCTSFCQFRVVAIGAVEVAPGKKDHRAHHPGIVDQGISL